MSMRFVWHERENLELSEPFAPSNQQQGSSGRKAERLLKKRKGPSENHKGLEARQTTVARIRVSPFSTHTFSHKNVLALPSSSSPSYILPQGLIRACYDSRLKHVYRRSVWCGFDRGLAQPRQAARTERLASFRLDRACSQQGWTWTTKGPQSNGYTTKGARQDSRWYR